MYQERINLLDGNNVYGRAWFASAKKGMDSGTVKKTINTFKGMVVKQRRELIPDHIVICWDDGKDKERLELLPSYKERDKRPNEYYSGMKALREEIESADMQYLQVQEKDVEADDLIGTLAQYYALTGRMVTIVSDDKDMLQLLCDNIVILHSKKGMIDVIKFKEEFGFEPESFIDYLALKGDEIDNIPGIPGIGEVKAKKLIKDYGTLESLYEKFDTLPDKLKKTLDGSKDNALLYKRLIRLKAIDINMSMLPD